MQQIKLPGGDVIISKAVFGTSRLGGTVERYDKPEALAILKTVLDSGINCFDTADIYAQGNSERLLAEAFRSRRDEVLYATKGGYVLSRKARLLAKLKPFVRRLLKSNPGLSNATGRARGGQMAKDFSRGHLTRAVEASLSRLRTDRIDIYQLHSPDPANLVAGDAFEVLAELKSAGKIRAYGVSVLSWDDVPHCLGHDVSWIQVDADLLGGKSHHEIAKQVAEDNILLVARQAFGSGLLASPPESWSAGDFGGNQAALMEARHRIRLIQQIGDPHEVILRFLHHHSSFGAFLFATTRTAHLKTNLAALVKPGFTGEAYDTIESVFPTANRTGPTGPT